MEDIIKGIQFSLECDCQNSDKIHLASVPLCMNRNTDILKKSNKTNFMKEFKKLIFNVGNKYFIIENYWVGKYSINFAVTELKLIGGTEC